MGGRGSGRKPAEPKQLAEDRPLWEQQPGETDSYYSWFTAYRDLGRGRTQAKLCEKVQKSRSWLSHLSIVWSWPERALAWDKEQDRLWQAEVLEQRRAAAQKAADISENLMNVVEAQLKFLNERLLRSDGELEISLPELARVAELAYKNQRLAYGESDSNVSLTGADGGPVEIAVTEMSPEERRARLERLLEEAQRRTVGDSNE